MADVEAITDRCPTAAGQSDVLMGPKVNAASESLRCYSLSTPTLRADSPGNPVVTVHGVAALVMKTAGLIKAKAYARRRCHRLRSVLHQFNRWVEALLVIFPLCGVSACHKSNDSELAQETEWVERIILPRTAVAISHEPDRPGDNVYQIE